LNECNNNNTIPEENIPYAIFFIFGTLGIIALARDVPSCQGLAYLTYCLKL